MKKVVTIVCAVLLVAVAAALLVACAPSIDSVKKTFEDAGYTVVAEEEEGVQGLVATKDDENITIVFFEDSETADLYEATAEATASLSGVKIARKGNVLAVGTEGAIELFK